MSMPSPPRKRVHTALIPIRWGDMDAFNHVNNTVYFRYMEQARVEYLETLGYSLAAQRTAPVIINTSCTFLLPLTYPGLVEVQMFLSAPGRSSVASTYEIHRQGDATRYAHGDAKIVWIEIASGKSVPIPERLREQLADLL